MALFGAAPSSSRPTVLNPLSDHGGVNRSASTASGVGGGGVGDSGGGGDSELGDVELIDAALQRAPPPPP
eukprot:CAMPEP_0198307584 /NCGR_PEP_ID=MMETSP1450-20131203/400_1 /TAXON_ID=753684 ORGANISM="Madagascaria erythrocladiodes, Strain CCMP3234" /NCGR_SAMPLE_ID=MMETSP1450 /ASSEMBLY_ACC=CAM_ASM_001115 /LENGTH=69 /DNA_ID=CAMNT_0044010171 /DNA_START=95 /DNA_END=301 /DNA_ORIENTATION=+